MQSTLPAGSRSTVTLGWSASNSAFTFSNGPVRLPAWKIFTWTSSPAVAVGVGVVVWSSVVPVQPQNKTAAATMMPIRADKWVFS